MPRELTSSNLLDLARSGDSIFVAGGTGEPTAILAAWRAARALQRTTLVGFQVPGLNRLVPEELGDGCRLRTSFLTQAGRASLAQGRVELLPLHQSAFYDWLARTARIDLAVFQVAPPDAEGRCSLGPSTDFLPAILSRPDIRLFAQINRFLPPCRDGIAVELERLDAVYRAETELPQFAIGSGEDGGAIAAHAATLVEDGATVQIGIGRLPDQVLARLSGRRGLKLHGGTISAAGLALLEGGAAERIVAGIAMGDSAFYARAAAADRVAFRPVTVTHGPAGLAGVERFIALNSALEVDLFGQANCETAAGRLYAGFGGINDFLRAARASPGGRAVVMLPATGAKGKVSRIVARVGEPGLVSVQRGDLDTVVTEHGIADLRGLDLDARAAALIAVAAPAFRDELTARWRQVRAGLA
jgi:acyl-CoA hydrolase